MGKPAQQKAAKRYTYLPNESDMRAQGEKLIRASKRKLRKGTSVRLVTPKTGADMLR